MGKKKIAESIINGIRFLRDRQLPSGEFATMKWQKFNLRSASYERSVFTTSLVLHSLRHLAMYSSVSKMGERAIAFLLNNKEKNGLWRFGGKDTYFHFDMDDTCCVLASLNEWGVELDYYSQAVDLLKYRDEQGLFYTWILDVDPPFKKDINNIDWVVNANALFFYSLINHPLPVVEQYLNQVVDTGLYHKRSFYYDPTFAFIYCLTRAYSDGLNNRSNSAVKNIEGYLLGPNKKPTIYGRPLENAITAVALLNISREISGIELMIGRLIDTQNKNGGWPIDSFFWGGPYVEYDLAFGSEELTTAIALEAMAKYWESI